MASTALPDHTAAIRSTSNTSNSKPYTEKYPVDETPIAYGVKDEEERTGHQPPYSPGGSTNDLKPVADSTHRKLKPRHIQLIGIGGYV